MNHGAAAFLLAAFALGGCQPGKASVPQQSANPGRIAEASGTTFERLEKAPEAPSEAHHELGRKIYNFRCYFCHGYSGNARTLASTYLNPRPRDFTAPSAGQLSRDTMLAAVRDGKPGTAMKSFSGILSPHEMEAVTDFVRDEFVVRKAQNTRYHTAENGWKNHERYRLAFPFATGEIPLDKPWQELTPDQASGKRLFLSACVSCHDRARVMDEGPAWESRPLSYPRNNYSPGNPPVDGMASASPYALHDRPPRLAGLNALEKRGEALYQENCAFCHAADGTGHNWIGSFMEPHPRNLTDPNFMISMSKTRLHNVIREGLPGTSMSAWKTVLGEKDIQAVIAYVSKAFYPLPEGRDPE